MTGYTPCSQKLVHTDPDVKGLNRLHQFDKIELVRIEHPDHSYDVLIKDGKTYRSLLQKLELPYRILEVMRWRYEFQFSIDI